MLEHYARRFRDDDTAAVGLFGAAGITLMLAASTLAVDVGAVYLAKRDLQNAANAAAVVAVDVMGSDGAVDAEVRELLRRRGTQDVTVDRIEPGDYRRTGSVDLDQRFVADQVSPTAARVTVSRSVPLYFGRILTGQPTMTVEAVATAARLDRAAFQVGARLGSLSGGVPNALLSAIGGEDLQLTADDFSDLEGTAIDVMDFADVARQKTGLTGATYGEVFREGMPLNDLMEAFGDVSPNDDTKTIFYAVSSKVGGDVVTLADMIDLGPYAHTDFNDGTGHIKVDAATLMRGALEYAHGTDGYDVQANLSVAGQSATKMRVVGGNVVATSPLITVTDSDNVTVRTGRMRIYLETTIPASVAGIASLKVPVYAEIASAQAKLSSILSSGTTNGVTLAVTPSIGTVAIAQTSSDALGNLTAAPTLSTATLASVIGVKVKGSSILNFGGATAKSVFFSKEEVAARTVKSVATDDAVTALVGSLVRNLTLSVEARPLVLTPSSTITSSVGTALTGAAPALDEVLNAATRTMGIQLGLADSRVNAMKCGMPTLVA